MPFLPVLIKLKSRENNNLIFIVSHVTRRINHPVFFLSYFFISLLARSQTFDTIVRVMLIMLRKNTRNNILIGGMHVCERDQRQLFQC